MLACYYLYSQLSLTSTSVYHWTSCNISLKEDMAENPSQKMGHVTKSGASSCRDPDMSEGSSLLHSALVSTDNTIQSFVS